MDDSVRIANWLWAVRIFKTRSDAAEACRTNRVTLNGSYTKPSREIKPGDTVTVRKTLVTYSFRVLAPRIEPPRRQKRPGIHGGHHASGRAK